MKIPKKNLTSLTKQIEKKSKQIKQKDGNKYCQEGRVYQEIQNVQY